MEASDIPAVHQTSPLLHCIYNRRGEKGVGDKEEKDAKRMEGWGVRRSRQGERRGPEAERSERSN